MGERVVLHSDLNNCYASIECMLHPELRGKYIAVCGSTEDRHGIVLAKNQLAKQCGVKTGDVIWEVDDCAAAHGSVFEVLQDCEIHLSAVLTGSRVFWHRRKLDRADWLISAPSPDTL